MNTPTKFAALFLAAAGLAACSKDPPPAPPPPPKTADTADEPAATGAAAPGAAASTVAVASATLGTAIGPNQKITAPADSFAKTDTIYLSVETTGEGTANLRAKWSFTEKDGKPTVAADSSQNAGPGTTVFNVSNSSGWPVGSYTVEILVDEKPAQTKSFSVK